MSVIEELVALLHERGVECDKDTFKGYVFWGEDEDQAVASDDCVGKLWVSQHCTPEQAIAATLGPVITGDTSDGYHTFNELYHHRAVLFSVIVRDHADLAWKSKAHHDGTMYDGMFIVGIETPQGQATYHYDIDYWDMFECRELERAPEWDGHTPDQAIARIATLGSGTGQDEGDFDREFAFGGERARSKFVKRHLPVGWDWYLETDKGTSWVSQTVKDHIESLEDENAKSLLECDMWRDRAENLRNRLAIAQAENDALKDAREMTVEDAKSIVVMLSNSRDTNAKLRSLCARIYGYAHDENPEGTELNFAAELKKLRIEVPE